MDPKDTKKMNAEMSAALFSDTERFEMLFAAHWKKVAAGSLAIAVIIAGIFAVYGIRNNAARKAAHALADATEAASLEKALAQYGNTPGAIPARQRLVKILTDAKNYDGALKQLSLLVADEKADAAVRGRARLDQAAILELTGKTKEAAAAFAKCGSDLNLSAAVRLEGCCGAGRLFAKLKQPDQAADALNLAKRIAPNSQSAAFWSESAKSLLIALENGELGAKPAAKIKK